MRRDVLLEAIRSQGGLSAKDAERVFAYYKKAGITKYDAHGGWSIVDGGFLDPDVIGRAVEVADNPPRSKRGSGMKFLINPGGNRASKGGTMAKRKTPPRYKSGPKKGQFMPKSARRRKSRKNPPKRKSSPRRRTSRKSTARKAPRRRTYRRNPVRRDIVGQFMEGAVEAGQILIGKAAARSVPDLVGLPKQGNVGLAIQAAVAVGVGIVADQFLGRDAARAMLAGGLTAPMETLIVAYNVPWLSSALSPVSAGESVGAYVRAAPAVNGAAARALPNPGRSVTRRGLGRYAAPAGMMYNN